MGSHKKSDSTLEEQEQERLRRKIKEWRIQQKLAEEHEKRKLKMIEEWKRTEAMKKKRSLYERQSKSNSPQRRKTSSSEHFKDDLRQKASANGPEGIIDKKELQKIKITIENIYKKDSLPTKNQSTSNKIERDIVNLDDIFIPRRKNEGACPIFQESNIKAQETITSSRNKELDYLSSEKQLSTNRKNVHRHRRPNDITEHDSDSSSHKSTRNNRTDDKYNRNRRNSSIRDSKEKNRDGRNRSTSRYNSSSATLIRNRSRSPYRSRNHSLIRQTKETRIDSDKNKSPFKKNYSDQPRELNNRVPIQRFTNYPLSTTFYDPYMHLPRPMLTTRTPMFMPVFPGPGTFPMNLHRWPQPPPRFINASGIPPKYRYCIQYPREGGIPPKYR